MMASIGLAINGGGRPGQLAQATAGRNGEASASSGRMQALRWPSPTACKGGGVSAQAGKA